MKQKDVSFFEFISDDSQVYLYSKTEWALGTVGLRSVHSYYVRYSMSKVPHDRPTLLNLPLRLTPSRSLYTFN